METVERAQGAEVHMKKLEAPLVWIVFFLLLGGAVGLNIHFLLLLAAIIIHLV
jgi:hypothetical protein